MKSSILLAGTVLFGFMSSPVNAVDEQSLPGIGGSSYVYNYNTLTKKQPAVKTPTKLNKLPVSIPAQFGNNYILPEQDLQFRLQKLKIPKAQIQKTIATGSSRQEPELKPAQFFFNRQYKSLVDSIRIPSNYQY